LSSLAHPIGRSFLRKKEDRPRGRMGKRKTKPVENAEKEKNRDGTHISEEKGT